MGLRCLTCLRWLVFALNLFFWLAGMGVLGVALWLRFDPDVDAYLRPQDDDLHDFYVSCYILIGVGLLMALLGFLGCCGALRQSQCMLTTFFVLLLIVFIGELVCAVLAYGFQDKVQQYVKRSMYDTVYQHYGRQAVFTKSFDRVQKHMHCCGVESYADWLRSYYATEAVSTGEGVEIGMGATSVGRVPHSCCNELGRSTFGAECGEAFIDDQLSSFADFLHPDGCNEALYNKLYGNLNLIIIICVVLGTLQLIGMFLSMLLCCWIGEQRKEDLKQGIYY